LLLLCLPLTAFAAEPTAIVIDADTDKPVEGAVALAQWHRSVPLGLGLGATQALEKALETFSDKDGKVYIDGFWGLYVFSLKPRLTVYKPGYVIWDNQEICPVYEKRTDFDSRHRTVKLLQFDNEAARWLKYHYDEGRGGPRAMHNSFFHACYDSEVGRYTVNFRNIFYQYEKSLIDAEEMERRKKEKSK